MGHCFKAGLLATTTERGNEAGIAAALEAAERHIGHRARARAHAPQRGARLVVAATSPAPPSSTATSAPSIRATCSPCRSRTCSISCSGNSTMLRDRPAQVLHAWGERDPQRGLVLGMHAFGLEECGAYDDAEAIRPPRHGTEPGRHLGRARRGARAGNARPDARRHRMDQEHRARLERVQFLRLPQLVAPRALSPRRAKITRRRSRCTTRASGPAPSRVAGEMVDASALLWRLRLRNVDVGDRWTELAESWEALGDDGYYAFNDVHALMAFLATGDQRQAATHRGRPRGCGAPRRHQRHDEPRSGTADGARAVRLRTPGLRDHHRRAAARARLRAIVSAAATRSAICCSSRPPRPRCAPGGVRWRAR